MGGTMRAACLEPTIRWNEVPYGPGATICRVSLEASKKDPTRRMTDPPTTRASLVLRLRDPRDAEAWERLVEVYAPMLHRFAMRQGLQEADASDVTQDVLRRVSGAIRRLEYDPTRGSFRGWLLTITRNEVRRLLTSRARKPLRTGEGTTLIRRLEAEPANAEREQWEAEFQRSALRHALGEAKKRVKDTTWSAFVETALEGREAADVATELGMTVGAVWVAKSRVLTRIREIADQLDTDEDRTSGPGRTGPLPRTEHRRREPSQNGDR